MGNSLQGQEELRRRSNSSDQNPNPPPPQNTPYPTMPPPREAQAPPPASTGNFQLGGINPPPQRPAPTAPSNFSAVRSPVPAQAQAPPNRNKFISDLGLQNRGIAAGMNARRQDLPGSTPQKTQQPQRDRARFDMRFNRGF